MAYPRCSGDDPLKYEEYDPTPFSGGYDQVALYGRPKSPSSETCYPKSESYSHESGGYGGGYEADYSDKPASSAYGVDEERPSYQDQNPPHGSDDYAYSGYGRTGHGSGHGSGHVSGHGSGHGRPRPGQYQDEGGYGGYKTSYAEEGEGGYGSGHGRPKPPYEEGGGDEYGSGYGGEEERYGRRPGHGSSGHGDPHREEHGGYGGSGHGGEGGFGHGGEGSFGRPGRFGGDDEGGYGGGSRPGGYGGEGPPSYYGDEPPPPADQGYGGYQGGGHRHEHHHRPHWGRDDE